MAETDSRANDRGHQWDGHARVVGIQNQRWLNESKSQRVGELRHRLAAGGHLRKLPHHTTPLHVDYPAHAKLEYSIRSVVAHPK
jgi:hypothetical protein